MPETKDKTKEGTKVLDTPLTPAKKTSGSALIYAGPTVPGVVASGSVFINGIPANVAEAVKKCPSIGELIVPVKQANKMRKELAKKDGAARRFYEEAEKYKA